MPAQLSKTARRSSGRANTVRLPFQVFRPNKPGRPTRLAACFPSQEEAEAFAAQIGGYVFFRWDQGR
jgi:hypothetical protein